MSKPKRNIELLKRLRTRFTRMRHKKHFDMRVIGTQTACGTQACIGGHALLLDGYKLRMMNGSAEWYSPKGRLVIDPLATAARLLGLTVQEARAYEISSGIYRIGTRAERRDVKQNGLFYRWDMTNPKKAAALIQEYIDGTR